FVEDIHFPADFFEIGALFVYKEDKNSRRSLYLRIKFVSKVPELRDILKQFLVHTVYKIDEQSSNKGYVLILDFKGASVKNCDLDLVSFLINTLKNYFPYGVQCILVNELPWILTAFWKLVETWIPENARELIKCTKYSTLREYFDESNLPDFAGGCCLQDYRDIPKGCLDGEEFGTRILGIPRNDVQKIMKKYRVLVSA
ncbi:motile sperm domain-containing protein 2-like protein, partial [Leptotrombidium deliense]